MATSFVKRAKYDNYLTPAYLTARPFAADHIILSQISAATKVLDVGCSTGFMGDYLQREKQCQVWGVEYDPVAAEQAQQVLQGVIVGDLDNPEVVAQIKGQYDYIILGAILEHLKNPLAVLQQCSLALKPGGRMIISLPNVAHYTIRWRLLWGDFTYGPYGILDETHCKIYTKYTATKLLKQAGLRIQAFQVSVPFPGSAQLVQFSLGRQFLNILARGWPTLFGEELIFTVTV